MSIEFHASQIEILKNYISVNAIYREHHLGMHLKILAKGKRISLCPPPFFILTVTLVQIVIFLSTMDQHGSETLETLMFHSGCTDAEVSKV